MAKKEIAKPFCNGMWTKARMRSFIVSLLRKGTMKWAPKNICAKNAKDKAKEHILKNKKRYPEHFAKNGNYKPGQFICEECGTLQKVTLSPPPDWSNSKKDKIQNCVIDHIEPIVDPAVGFTTYDNWIARCFCELDNLACICAYCHHIKCKEEKDIETERKRKEKIKQA
jgi:hypothetical protein